MEEVKQAEPGQEQKQEVNVKRLAITSAQGVDTVSASKDITLDEINALFMKLFMHVMMMNMQQVRPVEQGKADIYKPDGSKFSRYVNGILRRK